MRKSLFRWTVAMLTLSAAAVSGACSEQEYEDLTKPEKVTGNTQYAPYTIDWTEAADSCSTAFIERFYCTKACSRTGNTMRPAVPIPTTTGSKHTPWLPW